MGKLDVLSRKSNYSTRALDSQDMVLLYLEFFIVHTIKRFALECEEHNILRDIYCGNQSGKQKKMVTKIAKELQCSSKWSETNSLLLF